jgi:hypothetical protein
MVGSRFRPQGRDPRLGLDCLGLAAAAYNVPPSEIPSDYRLRGDHLAVLLRGIDVHFRRISIKQVEPGDMLLCEVARDQHHLVIRTRSGFIHADARHGVVETPGEPPWPLLRAFRRRTL